ncbi:bifunctional phosphoribosylaminoimidazolecarboxamide formyltransferase/IMP cyclohydrolase [Leptolyngbya sp. 7M]|uniref:bifunctional phosphoribosylaminoimidazolecarboxamide formyltransferase/IMP cyclohydrolase n=1 Tax=Leptolyngbya sp. 7M TaxID=2812896 RepID=UPI001B8AAF20|nr:bifunctional phosphoribosylaminoimidazolecarboxamide formyltransferase/IMP cyclohydrolase [Leptolyngbya sp. 7M]QYO66614.1 bifunctional phosphoribosylaminoimidazolecarboxamide formyltransferase/IMP cyclohydrolase [Leptolyngbya sp. 7M]
MDGARKIKKALFSLSDKTGAVEFARKLAALGVEIISTGGTAKTLREAGIAVTDVADVTGFPEMMDGRVKTLHPKIHGAFLALRDNKDHLAAMNEHGIEPIDLVVVNLYPFEQTIAQEGVSLEEAIENIDIGGPAMIRSASKNWRDVAVVTDPGLYASVIDELDQNDGSLSVQTRRMLATLAYTRTASYDLAISSYLAGLLSENELEKLEPFNPLGGLYFIDAEDDLEISSSHQLSGNVHGSDLSNELFLQLAKVADLRYGENPHQRAALYRTSDNGGIAAAEQLHGKEMSFNNYLDAEAAFNLVQDFEERAVAIIKHTNPSGVGVGETNELAYRRALSTDPVSAFGGIVAFNTTVDPVVAASVNEVFTEVVIAPDYDEEALGLLRSKKNLRVLKLPFEDRIETGREYRQISGGFLVQDKDTMLVKTGDLRIVSKKRPDEDQIAAMLMAWRVCKHVKSNAIVLADRFQTLGVGSGQMNRVDSVRIAGIRAERFGLKLEGSALASDAFFPFRDNVDEAAKMGVSAIIQPGGSVKDEDSIAAANEHGIVMAFTGIRHFKH